MNLQISWMRKWFAADRAKIFAILPDVLHSFLLKAAVNLFIMFLHVELCWESLATLLACKGWLLSQFRKMSGFFPFFFLDRAVQNISVDLSKFRNLRFRNHWFMNFLNNLRQRFSGELKRRLSWRSWLEDCLSDSLSDEVGLTKRTRMDHKWVSLLRKSGLCFKF